MLYLFHLSLYTHFAYTMHVMTGVYLRDHMTKFCKNYSVPADPGCSAFLYTIILAHSSMLTIYLPKVVIKLYK